MRLNFSKKRKFFSSNFGSRRKNVNFRHDAARERVYKNKIAALKILLLKSAVLIAVIALFYLLFFSSFFSVKEFLITGNKKIDENSVKEAINRTADEKIMKIFSKRNLLLMEESEIENLIKNRFSNISNVEVEKKFPSTLRIEITEKPADIAWCNRIKIERVPDANAKNQISAPAAETAQCYYGDESNVVYGKSADETAEDSIKVFRDEKIDIGIKIGDESLKNFIRELAGNFNRKTGLNYNYLYLPPTDSRELHLITDEGWKIYFDLNRGVNDQLWVLNSVLKNKISDSERGVLDYVDLRVIDRFIYKTK